MSISGPVLAEGFDLVARQHRWCSDLQTGVRGHRNGSVGPAFKPFDDDGQVDVFGREAGLVNAFRLAASGASALRENTTRHPFVAIPATHMKWSDTTTRARAHLLTHVRLVERFES